MPRFKHFSGVGTELEQAVNQWLTEFEPDVTQMVQTVSGDGSLSISFLFEESFRGQELRLSAGYGQRAPVTTPDKPVRVPIEPGQPLDEPGDAPADTSERSA